MAEQLADDVKKMPGFSAQKKSKPVTNKKIRAQQIRHASLISIIPFLGLVLALVIASQQGVSVIDIGLLIGMYIITYIGIDTGLHRHFSHRSFKTVKPVRALLAIFASMAAQGPVTYWVSNHRYHHQFSDQPEDLHSPYVKGDKELNKLQGFWHSHMGWTFNHKITSSFKYAKDLLRDPLVSKINKYYYYWILLGLIIPAVIGGIFSESLMGAFTGFLWGGLVRLFLTYQATNCANSVAHLFGRRPYVTKDNSANNALMCIPTFGGTWHNNHHAFPNSARFGLEWWEIDIGWWIIRILQAVSLAWDVNTPSEKLKQSRKK